jgi:hypothetical protein
MVQINKDMALSAPKGQRESNQRDTGFLNFSFSFSFPENFNIIMVTPLSIPSQLGLYLLS